MNSIKVTIDLKDLIKIMEEQELLTAKVQEAIRVLELAASIEPYTKPKKSLELILSKVQAEASEALNFINNYL